MRFTAVKTDLGCHPVIPCPVQRKDNAHTKPLIQWHTHWCVCPLDCLALHACHSFPQGGGGNLLKIILPFHARKG